MVSLPQFRMKSLPSKPYVEASFAMKSNFSFSKLNELHLISEFRKTSSLFLKVEKRKLKEPVILLMENKKRRK